MSGVQVPHRLFKQRIGLKMNEEKESLINLIIWYRDEYHKGDFGHNDLIQIVKEAKISNELEHVWQIVDGWLD